MGTTTTTRIVVQQEKICNKINVWRKIAKILAERSDLYCTVQNMLNGTLPQARFGHVNTIFLHFKM